MAEPTVTVHSLSLSPNNCDLDSPLEIECTLEVDRDVEGVTWELDYLVDFARGKHSIPIGSSGPFTYKAGEKYPWKYSVESIDVSAVPRSALKNMGLVRAKLGDFFTLTCVTQVQEDKQTGKLQRMIFNPLE